MKAPDFKVPDQEGKIHSLSDYLINPKGEIAKEYKKVNPIVHSSKILEGLDKLL